MQTDELRQDDGPSGSEVSTWARIPGALLSPGKTFRAIAARPTWLLPLLLVVVFGVLAYLAISPKVDYSELVRSSFEQRGQTLPEEQLERSVALAERFGQIAGLVAVGVFQPVGLALVALLFWVAFKVQGSVMDYKVSLGVAAHSWVPLLLSSLASGLLAFGRDTMTLQELQQGVLKSNLAFLAGDGASAIVTAALRGLDFFSFWVFALYAIGYTAASRLKQSTVTATVVGVWVVWYVVKVGLASLGSLFGGG